MDRVLSSDLCPDLDPVSPPPKFYSSIFYMYVDDVLRVNFCVRHEVGHGSYIFAYGCPIALIPFVEKAALFFLH